MRSRLPVLLLIAMISSCNRTRPSSPPPVVPLIHAHAHNDYEHRHPLYDAMDCGFCSIEADIFLVDGKLLVAHQRNEVSSARTLESLYLHPLQKRVRENSGRVYRGGPTVTLMIDFKSPPESMYPVLRAELMKYTDMLTSWRGDQKDERAITIILTGERPTPAMVASEDVRFVALDGHLEDLHTDVPPGLMPRLGIKWQTVLHWDGRGTMPEAERAALRKLVERAHARGRELRLWGAPDNPNAWSELRAAGVDLINTDDLPGLRDFVLENPG